MVYYASLIYDKATTITIRLFDPAEEKWWDGGAWTATEGSAESTTLTETALSDAANSRYTATVSTWPTGYYVVEYLDGGDVVAEEGFGYTYNDLNIVTPTTPINNGKSTYLELVNKVLKRITQSELSSGVSTAVGTGKIIAELINEAQVELWTESTNWHSLYATRTFDTVASTATYALTATWGRTLDLLDTTTGTILTEDFTKTYDFLDPDSSETGTPRSYAIQGSNYQIYPIPDGVYTIRERYWKVPGKLVSDTDVSDLPLFCEGFIVNWAYMKVCEYLNKMELADRIRADVYGNPARKDEGILQKSKAANKKIIDTWFKFQPTFAGQGILQPPKFPSNY